MILNLQLQILSNTYRHTHTPHHVAVTRAKHITASPAGRNSLHFSSCLQEQQMWGAIFNSGWPVECLYTWYNQLSIGLTTGVWQPVVSCKRDLTLMLLVQWWNFRLHGGSTYLCGCHGTAMHDGKISKVGRFVAHWGHKSCTRFSVVAELLAHRCRCCRADARL